MSSRQQRHSAAAPAHTSVLQSVNEVQKCTIFCCQHSPWDDGPWAGSWNATTALLIAATICVGQGHIGVGLRARLERNLSSRRRGRTLHASRSHHWCCATCLLGWACGCCCMRTGTTCFLVLSYCCAWLHLCWTMHACSLRAYLPMSERMISSCAHAFVSEAVPEPVQQL